MFEFLKRKSKAVEMSEGNFSAQELAGALLSLAPELQESMSPADITLALDDRGWITSWSSGGMKSIFSPQKRREIIEDSRFYWHRDPLGKQPVRLWSDYAIGTGIVYKDDKAAQGDKGKVPGEKKPSDVQTKLDRFWKYHKNRCLTSSQGQWELSNQLLIDGDLFFAIFTDGDVPVLRTIDCLQITEIISDPEDDRTILCYKREIVGPKGDRKTLYYKDWSAEDSDLDDLKDPEDGKDITVEENVVVYQHSFEKFGKRGNGLLFCAIDWSRYHRQFMNARVSLTAALAKFAHKLTVKGSDKVVNAVASRLGSTIPANGITGLPERNPPTTAGGSFVQNQGLDLQPMPRTTGGGDAKTDGDQLKLMVCAATNVHQHYFGDPSTGNLATAEAMELPMLKSFTRYQESWKDCWRDIFSIVLGEGIDDEPAAIKIHLPPMLKDDLSRLGQFLMGLHQVFPEIQVPEILEMCLVALGAPNVEETMASIAAKQQELNAGPPGSDDPNAISPAGDSPLGQQLPQPSIKVTKFTPQPPKVAGSKESSKPWIEVTTTKLTPGQQIVPIVIKDSAGAGDAETVKAINRLSDILEKDSAPLLSEADLRRMCEEPALSK